MQEQTVCSNTCKLSCLKVSMWLLAVTGDSLMAYTMLLYAHVHVHVHVHVYKFLSHLTAHLVVSEA